MAFETDSLVTPVARTGGKEPGAFPHVCPYQPTGAAADFCRKMTENFQRNKEGCFAHKCNCELRRCIMCLAMNRKGRELKAVTDPVQGLCSEHIEEMAKPFQKAGVRPTSSAPPSAPVARPATSVPLPAVRPAASKTVEIQRRSPFTSSPVWSPSSDAGWKKVFARVNRALANGRNVTVSAIKIRPMKGQPRDYFPEEEQESMGESLGLTGQIQDIILRQLPPTDLSAEPLALPGGRIWKVDETEYDIVDGERRWRGLLDKGLEVRAKLIELDDEAAYFVSVCTNFNRVDHTLPERAKAIHRLMNGPLQFPIQVAAIVQGISKSQAEKLLTILALPQDVIDMMHPGKQKAKGEDFLGKSQSYEIARLGRNQVLHEYARDLARRVVRGQLKLSHLQEEVDHILARSGTGAGAVAERNQPARRLKFAIRTVGVAARRIRDARVRIEALKSEGVLLPEASKLLPDLESIVRDIEKMRTSIGSTKAS